MRRALPVSVAAGVAISLLAYGLSEYSRFLIGELAVFVIIAAGVNLMIGVAGMFSVASPAFVGIGATGTLALMARGVPILPAIAIAVVIGWAAGWLLGLIALRLSGIYLAIVSLGFLQAVLAVLYQGGKVTGGGYGLVASPARLPLLGDLTADDYAYIAIMLGSIVCGLCYAATNSRVGRGWIALKSHSEAAELQGVMALRSRTQAFAFSSAVIALAGGLFALLLGITNPSSYSADAAVTHLSYVVVGGMTPSIIGPIAGPAILFLIPEFFKGLGSYLSLFFAVLMIGVLVLAPRGISGQVEDLLTRLRLHWSSYRGAK